MREKIVFAKTQSTSLIVRLSVLGIAKLAQMPQAVSAAWIQRSTIIKAPV
jgi:hypothetical protein